MSSAARIGPARLLLSLELVVALSAAAGGSYGVAGAPGIPRTWLDGSPFHSFVIPGLILLVAVGGSAARAAYAIVRADPLATAWSIASGLILVAWIAVEVFVIPFSWLQPVFFAIGVAIVGTALRCRNSSPRKEAIA